MRRGIALWDVCGSAERDGSLDSDIKNAVPNDIESFLKVHDKIEKILLNGGKATSLYTRYFRAISTPHIALPSTSPANAKMSYAEKKELWSKALL